MHARLSTPHDITRPLRSLDLRHPSSHFAHSIHVHTICLPHSTIAILCGDTRCTHCILCVGIPRRHHRPPTSSWAAPCACAAPQLVLAFPARRRRAFRDHRAAPSASCRLTTSPAGHGASFDSLKTAPTPPPTSLPTSTRTITTTSTPPFGSRIDNTHFATTTVAHHGLRLRESQLRAFPPQTQSPLRAVVCHHASDDAAITSQLPCHRIGRPRFPASGWAVGCPASWW